MQKLLRVLVFAIFAAQCAVSSAPLRRRREADENGQDTGVVAAISGAMGMVESVPLVGSPIKSGMEMVTGMMHAAEDMTNGGIARVLGGAMPCVISKENGLTCTGINEGNDISTLVMGIVQAVPGLPEFLQKIMRILLVTFLNPAIDTMFGGVRQ